MIERTEYLNKLIALKDKQLIKVITGVRRCGKSTLFLLFQDYLLQNGVKQNQIQTINFEDIKYEELKDYKKLYQYLLNNLVKDKKNYIFLDEIQNVKDFQKAIDSLYIQNNIDVYITGSNAYLLSGELATLLSGRYIQIKMLPLSFKEFISEKNNINLQEEYSKYIEFGSFPYISQLENNSIIIEDYLKNILDSIIVKDIMLRYKIADIEEFNKVMKFMFDNIGNTTSIKKISDTLKTFGYKTAQQTIEKYINALKESFVLYSASRYDIKGKQYLQTGEKYYIIDSGLRYALFGKKNEDYGHILENIVYLELLRRGYNVFVGKNDNMEVDFIAINDNGTEYYQVSQTVLNEDTLKRELTPLENIKDHYPKYLLTLDVLPDADYNGIKRINVLNWLIK